MRNMIVLNKMFKGDYLDGNNLGHEIINLYRSDDGCNYLYLQPYGTMAPIRYGRVAYVLNVRCVSASEWKVQSVAKVESELFPSLATSADAGADLRYGGVSLKDIFADNSWTKEQSTVYATYKVSEVLVPKQEMTIYFGDGSGRLDGYNGYLKGNAAKTSPKQYFSPYDGTASDYKILKQLIDSDCWTPDGSPDYVDNTLLDSGDLADSTWNICGIEDSELAFSNALAYYIGKYTHLASNVWNSILIRLGDESLPADLGRLITVRREHKHIDVLVETDKYLIIVENKIHSGINGIDRLKGKSQLDDYVKTVVSEEEQRAGSDSRKVIALILAPDYNDADISEIYQGEEEYGIAYHKVFYSDLHDSLIGSAEYKTDDCFRAYINAMKKHIAKSNDLYYRMKKILFRRILNTNN